MNNNEIEENQLKCRSLLILFKTAKTQQIKDDLTNSKDILSIKRV